MTGRGTVVVKGNKASARSAAGETAYWRTVVRKPKLAPILALILIVYLAFLAGVTARYGFNPTSLIQIGERDAYYGRVALPPGTVVFRDSDGYDGQYFYYIARDPLFRDRNFVNPARYQRIGYPLLASAVALGRADAIPLALLMVNLSAVLAGAAVFKWLLDELRLNRWLTLLFAFNPGVILGVHLDLAFPLQMALVVAMLLAWRRQCALVASLLCSAALLVSESSVLFLIPMLLYELLGRRWRSMALLGLSVAPYLLLQVALSTVMAKPGVAVSAEHVVAPAQGLIVALSQLAYETSAGGIVRGSFVVATAIFVMLSGLVAARKLYRAVDVFSLGVVAHALFALVASEVIWVAYASAARVFAGTLPLLVLSHGVRPGRSSALLLVLAAALGIATLIRPFAITPSIPFFVTS